MSYNPGPSPKGAGAQELLAGLMADGDIADTAPEEDSSEDAPKEQEEQAKPKGKKDKKDAIAMMKALKEQQNAKKKQLADEKAAKEAEERLRNVDVADAGPFGRAIHDDKSASATAHVRLSPSCVCVDFRVDN